MDPVIPQTPATTPAPTAPAAPSLPPADLGDLMVPSSVRQVPETNATMVTLAAQTVPTTTNTAPTGQATAVIHVVAAPSAPAGPIASQDTLATIPASTTPVVTESTSLAAISKTATALTTPATPTVEVSPATEFPPSTPSLGESTQPPSLVGQPVTDPKAQAMLAMEGEDGRRLREQEELRRKETEMRTKLAFDRDQLVAQLGQVSKQKEHLELEWIKNNNQKQPLELQLEPIVAEEKVAQVEERKLEQDEAIAESTPGTKVAQTQDVEARRWAAQERRHRAEEQKWALAQQVEAVSASMELLGAEYRKTLAAEDELKRKIMEAEVAIQNLAAPRQ